MLAACLAVTKYLIKATLRSEGLILTHSSRIHTVLRGREVTMEMHEADLHVVSTVRKQREMNSGA